MLTREYDGLRGKILKSYLYHILLSRIFTFKFQGRTLRYFCHKYNTTFLNERTVEIPIVLDMIKNCIWNEIIEIGNVLPHYSTCHHDVLDKYEGGKGVINQDILSFEPRKKYDIALCISTLEHIGWDENPADTIRIYINGEEPSAVLKEINPAKMLVAFDKIKSLVNRNGKLILTFPTGYNPHLDEIVFAKRIHFDKIYCMKRVSWSNRWREDCFENVQGLAYNGRFPRANGLVIGVVNC